MAAPNPDVPPRLRARGPEPAGPACFTCGSEGGPLTPCPRGRRYESGAQVLYCFGCVPADPSLRAAAGVIGAVMERGPATAEDIAAAGADAGILLTQERMAEIGAAALDQARAECEDEFDELLQTLRDDEDPAAVALYFKVRYDRLQRLLAGHPASHLMSVAEICAAVDGDQSRADTPLMLEWDGTVLPPVRGGADGSATTLVPCTAVLGGPAALVLTDAQRAGLGALLRADQDPGVRQAAARDYRGAGERL
ncbi:MAG TPA: hypothetical protein VFP69_11730 [Streptomyces sp.]|nr:hypothetical protein [Streptomyces sp.]